MDQIRKHPFLSNAVRLQDLPVYILEQAHPEIIMKDLDIESCNIFKMTEKKRKPDEEDIRYSFRIKRVRFN